MKSADLQPSTIVITGVSRGLGRGMTDEFVRLGHTVFGCARTKSEIEELTRIYPEQDFQAVDVASDAQVKAWASRILKENRPPDLVLNNAAVINSKTTLWEVDSREFSDEVEINIEGVVNIVRHFIPSMISRKRGVIVNFISRWGTKVEELMAPYCATKWAVVAMTRVLAEELRPYGIAAVGLNPGIVRTQMLQKYLGNSSKFDTSRYPTPAQWARTAVPRILRLSLKDTGRIRNVPMRWRG